MERSTGPSSGFTIYYAISDGNAYTVYALRRQSRQWTIHVGLKLWLYIYDRYDPKLDEMTEAFV